MVLAQAGWILSSGPLAPVWLVVPIAVLTLLVIAAHVLALDKAEMPHSRRRIRKVNGLLMMFTVPLVAYAFGVASPSQARVFVLVWMIVAGLVFLVLMLAMLDIVNTWRVTWNERRQLKRQIDSAKEAVRVLQARGAGAV